MRWFVDGKKKWRPIKKYLIDWDEDSRSKEQTVLKDFLRQYWEKNIVVEEYVLPSTLLRCDFLNLTKRIAIEHDGKGCHEFNKFFHKASRAEYLKSIKNEYRKEEILEENDFELIRTETADLKQLTHEYFKEKYKIDL